MCAVDLKTLMLGCLFSVCAQAQPTLIEMLNQSGQETMLFSPSVVWVESKSVVTWKATDKTHNVAFIENGVPSGVPLFDSPYSQDVSYTFTVPGVYFYKCTSHFPMGMLGIIVVDNDLSNLAAIKALSLPPLAAKKRDQLVAQVLLKSKPKATSPPGDVKPSKTP